MLFQMELTNKEKNKKSSSFDTVEYYWPVSKENVKKKKLVRELSEGSWSDGINQIRSDQANQICQIWSRQSDLIKLLRSNQSDLMNSIISDQGTDNLITLRTLMARFFILCCLCQLCSEKNPLRGIFFGCVEMIGK